MQPRLRGSRKFSKLKLCDVSALSCQMEHGLGSQTETRTARTAGLRLCFRGTTILVASTMCKVSRISDTIALIAVRISLSHHDLLGDKHVLGKEESTKLIMVRALVLITSKC